MPASKKQKLETRRRNETRRPASAPLPEHRFGRDTVLAASHRGSVRPDWKRVPQPNQPGNQEEAVNELVEFFHWGVVPLYLANRASWLDAAKRQMPTE